MDRQDDGADDPEETARPKVERRAGDEGADGRTDSPDDEGADPTPTGDGLDEGPAERADDPALAPIESKVERATEADGDDEERLLREAREELADLAAGTADGAAPDEDAVERLARRIDRLLAASEERDEYGALMGASTNPEDEDAP